MTDGFLRVCAVSPAIRVADVAYNEGKIIEAIRAAADEDAKLIVFPEDVVCGYTCGDLFLHDRLLIEVKRSLVRIAESTAGIDALIFVGAPIEYLSSVYNTACVINRGHILGFVPKTMIPNYDEFYEGRQFSAANEKPVPVILDEDHVAPMHADMIFSCADMPGLKVAAELCEDLWSPAPPSIRHALSGANVIVNLSASNELIQKSDYRRSLVKGQSARLVCAYVYCSAGEGESTQDVVYSGHCMIAENGALLKESEPFGGGRVITEIDITRLNSLRRRMTSFKNVDFEHLGVAFSIRAKELELTRRFDPRPFVPSDKEGRDERCRDVLNIQAAGLKKRLMHTGIKKCVVGISGGLDSTLAFIVAAKAHDMLGLPRENITAITMPGFGTTDRTYKNACSMVKSMGATLKEIPIGDAVLQHFKDIGHDRDVHDVTYENSQARERTQILMDYANRENALVVGTGDMSELALGWATYNGDHMSMYGVNASVPKTLVRYLVEFYADTCGDAALSAVLRDVLDTPVSPELLPAEDGRISQKTEELVGPYELHDFFLYYMLRHTYTPKKIFRVAKCAFAGEYDDETILKWLRTFVRRFFNQHFKRSCLPDGPKVGTVSLSPRGDLRMPSDASSALWLSEIEELEDMCKKLTGDGYGRLSAGGCGCEYPRNKRRIEDISDD